MDDVDGCFACDLSHGRLRSPGGLIHGTDRWLVEHCVGPMEAALVDTDAAMRDDVP